MERPADRRAAHATTRRGEIVREFPLRRVGSRAHELEQGLFARIIEHTPRRDDLRTFVRELAVLRADHEPNDGRDADAEVLGDLSLRPVAPGAGVNDLPSKVQRVGRGHGRNLGNRADSHVVEPESSGKRRAVTGQGFRSRPQVMSMPMAGQTC